MKTVVYLFNFFLLFSCSFSGAEKTTTEKIVLTENPLCLDCYFYLFEKYIQEYDTVEVALWKDSVIHQLITGNLLDVDRIFQMDGGGPLGAHWNSDAPWFCVAKIKINTTADIFLNERLLKTKITTVANDANEKLVCFSILGNEWNKALKPISPSDYPKIYSEEEVKNLTWEENSPLGVGEFIEITLKDSTTKHIIYSRTFHIAYGE